ncbi:heme exporter protein A [Inhella inkyongensis]|uniref:Heme exporter protein A n=1 Tax=Inhella inkyongensis TaxID=392593 RepID=A0A840S7N7_9BURK|nr:heme ABC exporter ATP-binding protein CcmA [Inhella inkyongensis]MBB5205026.1 heme exporter protein A [Inhella inkyongensis]
MNALPPATADAAPVLLHAQQLVCERGERPLFAALDLSLRAGDCLWLRGVNGSGKTTLLRTLAGLRAPAAGRLQRQAPLLYLGHANALKDDLTVAENLRLDAALRGQLVTVAALRQALDALALGPLRARPVRSLSQGQRRRTALARLGLSLQTEAAELWLLDEPFDALDDAGVQALCALMAAQCARGGAVLFTSHQAVAGLRCAEQMLKALT